MAKAATKAKGKPEGRPDTTKARGYALGQGDIPPEEFGRRLKAARLEAGYDTLREAADAIGVSVQTYHDLESGRKAPGFSRVLTVVRLLGLDPRTIAPEWFPEDAPRGR